MHVPPMARHCKVRLPPGVRRALHGLRQRRAPAARAPTTRSAARVLLFDRPLAKEGRLGFWRWFLGAWGIGTYRKNDQVDVAWEVDGAPRVAHALDIEPRRRRTQAADARRRQGAMARRAPRIARVEGDLLSV